MKRIPMLASLAAMAMLVVVSISAAEKPAKRAPPSLIVVPTTSISFSGRHGEPLSPSFVQYRVSASTGTVRYSIRPPSWLSASPTFGETDETGVTITFTVNAAASRLPPGTYGPAVAFTNVTNGQGSTTRTAALVIQSLSPPTPAVRVLDGRGGYLLDNHGKNLLDDSGGRLLAR
jgi:hypothetical protein